MRLKSRRTSHFDRLGGIAVATVAAIFALAVPGTAVASSSWSGWEFLEGRASSHPAVTSWGPQRLDVFTSECNDQFCATHEIMHKWHNAGVWNIESFGNLDSSGSPAAVSWTVGRIDLFILAGGYLQHKYFDGSRGWSPNWEVVGGPFTRFPASPAVSSWGVGRLDVFMVNDSGQLVRRVYDDSQAGWRPNWENLGAVDTPDRAASAVSWSFGRIDIFMRGSDNGLKHKWYDLYGGGWSDWENLGGYLTSPPAVASWAVGRLDVFATDTQRSSSDRTVVNLTHRYYAGGWSTNWENLGGYGGSVTAVSWGAGRIDLFAPGPNLSGHAGLYHKWYN